MGLAKRFYTFANYPYRPATGPRYIKVLYSWYRGPQPVSQGPLQAPKHSLGGFTASKDAQRLFLWRPLIAPPPLTHEHAIGLKCA